MTFNRPRAQKPLFGEFKLVTVIGPSGVQFQLLINRIYNKFQNEKCLLRTSFERKRQKRFSQVLKTVENIAKEAIKARVIDVKITRVSNYRCPITQIGNL